MFDDDASSSRLQADDMIRTSPRDAVEMNSISALERARADIELMCAAYPDEVRIVSSTSVVASQQQQHCPSFTHQESMIIHTQQQQEQGIPSEFPFFFTLCLKKMNTDTSSSSVSITMELPHGYPQVSLRVVSYRGGNAVSKLFLEQIPSVIHSIAIAHAEKNEECGFILCSHLLEMYNQSWKHDDSVQTQIEVGPLPPLPTLDDVRIHSTPSSSCSKIIPWISGQNTITDRKSVFQAHVCIVQSLEDVQLALSQLKEMNSKIQRATHNMVRFILISIDYKCLFFSFTFLVFN